MWPNSRRLPRLVVAFFCASGITLLWMMAGAMTFGTVAEWLSGPKCSEDILVRADGFVIQSSLIGRTGGMASSSYRFADGRPVPADEVKTWTAGSWPTPGTFVGPLLIDIMDYAPHGWNYRLSSIWSSGRETAHWYLIHDDLIEGHAYFAGYDYLTRALVGYLGKDGLVEIRPPKDRQFSIDMRRIAPVGSYGSGVVSAGYGGHTGFGSQSYEAVHLPSLAVYLLSGDELWLADLRLGTARRLGQFPDSLDLKLAPLPPGAMDEPEKIEENLMLRTRTEMIQLSLDGKQLHRWSIPDEARERLYFDWYDIGEGGAVVRYTNRYLELKREDVLLWLAADGSVKRREVVEIHSPGRDSVEAGLLAAVMPSPAMYTLLFLKFASVNFAGDPRIPDGFNEALRLYWPFLLLVYLVSAALAVLAYRRQTRYVLPWAAAWAAFVFLLGIPGWFAYRWHRQWPLLKECGECHRAAPRDRDACASCRQLFAPPPMLGTEIFA